MKLRRTLRRWLLAAAVGATAACQGSSPSAPPGPAVFRVEVARAETFRVRLTDPARIAEAERHLAAGREGVLSGRLERGDGGFNAPYRWHLDPSSVSFPDVAIEVCDGLPSHVEANLDDWLANVRQYCPWSARLVAREI